MTEPAVLTCALTGVLTDPARFPVPVTPAQMAEAASQAWDAGATIVHVHLRRQEEGLGHLPSWEPDVARRVCDAIRERVPGMLINLSTGVVGDDLSGPLACLEAVRPEAAALNAGSLNYLKATSAGAWAWPPMLFDNPVPKVEQFVAAMHRLGIVPECECFDTGIVRSVALFRKVGLLRQVPHVSFVMGVESGMPARPAWLPLLVDELEEGAHWQVIAIGRQEVWDLHRACAEQGGDLRTGLEDTFYLPDGSKARHNGELIAAAARVIEQAGRRVATPAEARARLGIV